jgi:excisionase family DNA binding protein
MFACLRGFLPPKIVALGQICLAQVISSVFTGLLAVFRLAKEFFGIKRLRNATRDHATAGMACAEQRFGRNERRLRFRKEIGRMEEIMTPSEVAALLKIHLKTVYKLAEKGVIPGNRIGRSWRFSRSDVLELVSSSKPIGLSDGSDDEMKIAISAGK